MTNGQQMKLLTNKCSKHRDERHMLILWRRGEGRGGGKKELWLFRPFAVSPSGFFALFHPWGE